MDLGGVGSGLITALTGGLGGALLRVIPAGLALIETAQKRKQQEADQAHELAVMDKQIEAQRLLQGQRLELIQTQGQIDVALEQIKGSIEATRPMGNKWVDFANGITRPGITWWFFGLYAFSKTLWVIAALWAASDLTITQLAEAMQAAWNPEDSATLFGILSFWFLGRALDKQAAK